MKRILCLALLLGGCSNGDNPENGQPKGDTEEIVAGNLKFDVPADWKSSPPKNKLRKAQYAVPDKDKSEGDAEFVVFKFGHSNLDSNIDGWYGQFTGTSREDNPPEVIKVGDLEFHVVDLRGAYANQNTGENMPDARMVAAAVKVPVGNYFLKLIGPQGTVGDWVDEFKALVKSSTFQEEH